METQTRSDSGDTAPDGSTIRFRDRIDEKDISSLCAMTAETGFFSPDEVATVRELAEEALHMGDASGYRFLIIDQTEEDGAAGFACFGPVPCTHGSWHLYWIVVDHDQQGTGYGSALIKAVEKRVTDARGRKLFLETSSCDQYASTREFYHSHGYRPEARLNDYYDEGEDCLTFSKEFSR